MSRFPKQPGAGADSDPASPIPDAAGVVQAKVWLLWISPMVGVPVAAEPSFDVRPEDVARLSPLGFDHINMLGRYAFILPDGIARGELRPLRDPRHTADEG